MRAFAMAYGKVRKMVNRLATHKHESVPYETGFVLRLIVVSVTLTFGKRISSHIWIWARSPPLSSLSKPN